jgi:hypothetical protein
VNARRMKSDRKEREKKLDQAIEMTFPASDPIAVGRPTSTEAQQGRSVTAKVRTGDQRGQLLPGRGPKKSPARRTMVRTLSRLAL